MYRYSNLNRESGSSKLQRRVMALLILLLLIGVIVLGIIAGTASRYRNDAAALFTARMYNDIGLATTQVNSLSRTGGSTTTSVLSKIRQYLYGIQTINDINTSLSGTQYIETARFTSLYSLLDDFDTSLATGQQTTETQTNLTTQIGELAAIIDALQPE